MVRPAIRLIQTMALCVTFLRKSVIPSLKRNHQSAEPEETPKTRKISCKAVGWTVILNVAKIAMKESMVIGFVSVRKNVEKKSDKKVLLSIPFIFSLGLEKKILAPTKSKKTPPTI